MAREVGYFQDCEPNDPIYDEGPFVICNPLGNGWRIEQRGKTCPVLPDIEVYDILKRTVFGAGKWDDKRTARMACDHLNRLVKQGKLKVS